MELVVFNFKWKGIYKYPLSIFILKLYHASTSTFSYANSPLKNLSGKFPNQPKSTEYIQLIYSLNTVCDFLSLYGLVYTAIIFLWVTYHLYKVHL